MTPSEKKAYLQGIGAFLEWYPLRSSADLRENGTAYPFVYNFDTLIHNGIVFGTGPALPDPAYPPATSIDGYGAMYTDSFSPGGNTYKNVNDVWVFFCVNTPISHERFSTDANAAGMWQPDGRVYYPKVVGDGVYIPAPSQCDQNAGGYFDTTIMGLDQTHVAIGPHNGGELWWQLEYTPTHMVQDWGGSNTSHQVKILIHGPNPSLTATNYDYIGSSCAFAGVTYYESSFTTVPTKNSLIQGYTRQDHPNGFSGVEDIDYRTIGGIVYDQTAAFCPQSVTSYAYPPCIGLADQIKHEVTQQIKFEPVATDAGISTNTLTTSTPVFTAGSTGSLGRHVYITGIGYRKITTFNSTTSVVLSGASMGTLSNQTFYLSAYPNTTYKRWINGVQTVNNTGTNGQALAWEETWLSNPGATITGNVGFGEMRLLIQMTNKTSGIAHTDGSVIFQNLIFGTARIPMVGDSTDPTPYPRRGTRLVFL